MARQLRSASETGLYHVMMRGNNREYIFCREDQKKRFVELLQETAEAGAIGIAGWCLMDNHVHLVLQGDLSELTKAVKRINIRYAMNFNQTEDRIGHVFQDRFRSENVSNDAHFLSVLRYVHSNPVKARMIRNVGEYRWSSYKDYSGSSHILSEELRGLVLGYFNGEFEKYEAFHLQKDTAEYLEVKEDAEKHRMETAQEIISEYCRINGFSTGHEVAATHGAFEGLASKLLQESRLSHRKIAGLLGVTAGRIHQVGLKLR